MMSRIGPVPAGKAVFLVLEAFQARLKNIRVTVASDYATVLFYLNKQRGIHSSDMCLIL